MAVAVGLALLAGAVLAVRWWTHPDVLGEHGADIRMGWRPVDRAQWSFEVVTADEHTTPTTLTFTGTPRMQFSRNTAAATVAFSICEGDPSSRLIGGADGTGSQYCTTLRPIRSGTTLPYPSRNEHIIATVTPTRPGEVAMTRAEFSYSLDTSHWLRRGTDAVALDVVQRVY